MQTATIASEEMNEDTVHVEEVHPLSSFVFMEDTLKALGFAYESQRNLILWGKGGFGKSDVIIEFLKTKGINPYVMTMGSGTTTDRLFGGVNVKEAQTTGKIEYFVENSFMNHEYVVFEELFDAQDYVLEQLKDILSSKVFRNGTQIYPIKTKLIICATNKSRIEFSKTDSLKAMLERFPLEHEVKWRAYNKFTYEEFLSKRFGEADPLLVTVLDLYAKNSINISPRIALVSAAMLAEFGPDCLEFIAEFRQKPDLLDKAMQQFKQEKEVYKFLKLAKEANANYTALKNENNLSVEKGKELNKIIENNLNSLKSLKASDSIVQLVTDSIKGLEEIWTMNHKELILLEQVDDDVFAD